ncbi:acyltransferase family protein [uncultured Anaerobutyricum sp.]|nr:acyltransferase family protein [uncultured Anaerobutyricum sp.]
MKNILALIPVGILGIAAIWGNNLNATSEGYMSKIYTNAMKGIMCVIIMYVHIPSKFTNPIQDIIGSFAYVGVFAFFMISSFGCRTSVEKNPNYLNGFWRKRILALFIPAILINIVSFCVKLLVLNIFEMRGLYAFNQYIYAIIVAYFIFWLVWKTENIPVSKKDWIVGVICLLCSLLTYISPIKLFFIWPTESIGFIYGLILYHHKKSIINQLENNRFIKIIALFLLSAILGVLYMRFKSFFFIGGYVLRVLLAGVLLLLFSAITMNISFEGKLIQRLGNSSYEFYLGHLAVISIIARIFPQISSGAFITIVAFVTLIIAVLISKSSNIIIDALLKTRKD